MYELITLFFDICLFKKGPKDIPVSKGLLYFLTLIYAAVSFLLTVISSDMGNAVLQVIVEILLILGFSGALLFIGKKSARYLQTSCALMATDTIISFFAIPAIATLATQQGAGLAFLVIMLLMIWHWLVSGYIFSNALEQPFSFGLGIAFLYILISYQVMAMLFPELIVAE